MVRNLKKVIAEMGGEHPNMLVTDISTGYSATVEIELFMNGQ